MASTALLHRTQILQQLAAGHYVKDLAAQLDLHPSAISHALASDPEYRNALATGHQCRLDQWQREIELAADPFTLARAREAFKAASWRASVEHPERWGTQRDTSSNAITVQVVAFVHQQDNTGVMSNASDVARLPHVASAPHLQALDHNAKGDPSSRSGSPVAPGVDDFEGERVSSDAVPSASVPVGDI